MTVTERADAPYADGRERLLDELHRADLLLRRHLEEWWAERGGEEGRGLFISDTEVDRLLASADDEPPDRATDRRSSRSLDLAIETAADRIDARETRAEESTRLAGLAEEFDLDRGAIDALVLALAPALDRKYEKVFGYLNDDFTRQRPTVGLVGRILATDRIGELAGRQRFERGSTLVDEKLVTVLDDGRPFLGRPVMVPRRVANHLVGGGVLPADLADVATLVDPGGDLDSLELDPDNLDAVVDLGSELTRPHGEPPLAALVGRDETAARAIVESIAPGETIILRVPAVALSSDDPAAVVAAIRREVRLRDALVHVTGLNSSHGEVAGTDRRDSTLVGEGDTAGRTGPDARTAAGRGVVENLVCALDAIPGPVVISGDVPVSPRLAPQLASHRLAVIEIAAPDRDQRLAIWESVDLPADADPATLADAFRLTRGEIEAAVETASTIAGSDPDAAAIRAGCRAQTSHSLDEHAREIDPGYDWGDIVLPADTEAQLREAAAQVRHRGTVFESWGFADRYSRGNGVTLLFTGSSGTGKTMAAEVVANDVGLPLFAIDLAATTSKYVGETEKNLRRIFEEAERANALLFFDEADALFGKRSEVSDAHDRYANVEIDYLLQRLESHDGCVVLASNLTENIDEAFRRRINVSVDFPRPDWDARAEIWRGVLPEVTPTGDVDVDFLAEFELSGGNIRNVATSAAFMAAEADEPVGMAHLVRAMRRELQKTGRLFDRSDFEAYRRHLPRYG